MTVDQAKRLLRDGVARNTGQEWLELGAGTGVFTYALAGLLDSTSSILATDKDESALAAIKPSSGDAAIVPVRLNFLQDPLPLNPVDGILMANALHFVQEKVPLLKALKALLKVDGRILIIEYDLTQSNQWVPYPLPIEELCTIAGSLDLSTDVMATHPSRLNSSRIYSAKIQRGIAQSGE